jgi:uncharacterized protein (TIGR03437 family)
VTARWTAVALALLVGAGAWAQTAAPGSTKYPAMTLIPPGQFQMGDHYGFVDPEHPSDEVPLHLVWIDALYIGTYDVTTYQYAQFLNSAYSQGLIEVRNGLVYGKGGSNLYLDTYQALGYSSIGWNGSTFSIVDFRATHPVGVTWFGAAAYANWLSQQQELQPCYDLTTWQVNFTKDGYRLPTEAEWEYAGRGGQYNPYYIYPWGNDVDTTRANWPESTTPYATGSYPWTTPVGFYNGQLHSKADFGWPGSQATYQTSNGATAWGLYDMSGNNWQWVNDWYENPYYQVSPYKDPPGPTEANASLMPDGQAYHGMRGGTWYNSDAGDPGHGRVSNRDPAYYRAPDNPSTPYYHVSFRVARSAPAMTLVSAASNSETAVAPASIVTASGTGLGGGELEVTDSTGAANMADVFYASSTEVTFAVPPATAVGQATITISSEGTVSAVGSVSVSAVAPGLFSADGTGQGVAAGLAIRVANNGSQTAAPLFQCAWDGGGCSAVPFALGASSDQVFLVLFGTGMRGATGQATGTVGGVAVGVTGPTAQGEYEGLDQVELGPLPRSLAGRGAVSIVLKVNGEAANSVTASIE